MKQRTLESINLLEQITAARFYAENGRQALTEVIAQAMFLPKEDIEAICAAHLLQYGTLQEVQNALILRLGSRQGEVAEAVLQARKRALSNLPNLPFNDKSSWLIYLVRTQKGAADEVAQFELGCFQCATRRYEAAFATLLPLALEGNLNAMWLALGLARMQANEADEANLLGKLYGMSDQGIMVDIPDEAAARLEELVAKGYDIDSDLGMQHKIGF